jgi:hypothetical protein
MDGRFRADLFTEAAGGGAVFEQYEGRSERRYGISREEEEDLEEKLRGLGYL